jgi:glyoxylase-like metal-dependent hydrolase (beta-lactamase superfamily II)
VKASHFHLDHVLGAEDVAVVLRETAHPHDAVQATGGLVAVAGAELAVAQRQVAIALDALLEDQDVAGQFIGLSA